MLPGTDGPIGLLGDLVHVTGGAPCAARAGRPAAHDVAIAFDAGDLTPVLELFELAPQALRSPGRQLQCFKSWGALAGA